MNDTIPYCPHPDCIHHREDPQLPYTAFRPWGSYATRAFGLVARFRCIACGRTFSTQSFSVDYFAKRRIDYEDLLSRLVATSSLSAIGRAVSASTDTISNRISRASRQALAAGSRLGRLRRTFEDLAADGFESFCVSQYFPNNIHILVGAESQFVYACDYATIRRKGRMSPGQKARRARLERSFRAESRAVERSFARIAVEALGVLSDGPRPSLELWTDEHPAYPRGIASSPCVSTLREQGRILHRTISSRAVRSRDNPLFPVNYLDREIRKDLHEHVRESVCFGRNVNRQMERLSLYLFHHNYRSRHRARWPAFSHAIVAGYDAGVIEEEFAMIWKQRAMLSLTRLDPAGEETWMRSRTTPLGPLRDYLPAYAVV